MSSSSSDTCYGSRNSCPLTSITSCNHSEDITVTCSKLLYQTELITQYDKLCNYLGLLIIIIVFYSL